ncbi:hypothetical protein SNE40_012320 [Patella caerulea]|uniref:DMA domain-containing protein n=1 Tax=Patella caerulea TaxID=87958 RepID=A0AAN8JNI7_PATCE
MAAQVALKRQQAAEDAIAMGIRACVSENGLPIMTAGPLWGPGTVTAPHTEMEHKNKSDDSDDDDDLEEIDIDSRDGLPDVTPTTSPHVIEEKPHAEKHPHPTPVTPPPNVDRSKRKADKDDSTSPSAYRPGRLSHLEILERVFPYQRKAVLELVLQGCNGDLVKAIEHFLSAQDTVLAQQQAMVSVGPSRVENRSSTTYMPGLNTLSNCQVRHLNGTNKLSYGGLKSAFTPLPPPSGLHSAFSPQMSPFPPEALRAPFFHHPSRASHDFMTSPHLAYAGLGSLPATSLPSMLTSPFSFTPYRFAPTGLSLPKSRTPDKNSDKSGHTDSDHISDSWEDGSSPRDPKDIE